MVQKKIMLLFIVLLLFPVCLMSQPAETTEENTKKPERKKSGFVPLAIPFYLPETKFGIGATLIYYNNSDPGDPYRKPDEYHLWLAATQKKQMSIGINVEKYFRGDDIKLKGGIEGDKWPDTFWGIGPDTKDDDDESYTDSTFYLHGSVLMRLTKGLYLGPLYRFRYINMVETDDGGLLENDDIRGSDGTLNTGPGIHLSYDTRDRHFYPRKGFLLETIASTYPKFLGSEYNFSKLEIDYRHYLEVCRKHVLAFQATGSFSYGSVPLQSLYKLGGQEIMRGIYSGRYRDKQYIATQLEYRTQIYWRFGAVLFGSLGQVAPAVEDFNTDNFVYAWGFGIRFTADKSEHINFRLDSGFDQDFNSNFYFTVKEAF